MTKILVVDDEPDIIQLLRYNLQETKCQVLTCDRGGPTLELAVEEKPDLIVLDLMLPDMNGLDVCRELKSREDTRSIPILMLTARGEPGDRIAGLELGADDYVVKPFSPRELLLRIQAILRRVGPADEEQDANIDIHGMHIDLRKRQVRYGGKRVLLTNLEFKLLVYLARHPGIVLTRERLLEVIWGYSYFGGTRTVDTHIRRLRMKLGEGQHLIETLVGAGYRFTESGSQETTR